MGYERLMSRALMIQGTASSVGKSVLTAAFCRLFSDAGHRVAPFKSQNMSNNSWVTEDRREIARAQVFQAQAARVTPHVDMSPILLKPGGDTTAQVVVLGESHGEMNVAEYHDFQGRALEYVRGALSRLRSSHDVVVIEGAGSPAEVNLRESDIANMRIAEMADAPVILVGDIERGGVFASLVGTLELLTESERARVRGIIINKFRGDPSLLNSGLEFLESRLGIPVLGVVPWLTGLIVDEEDAVALPGDATAPRSGRRLDVVVIRFPHISNATDFQSLAQVGDVSLSYVSTAEEFGSPDLVILPGTKATLGDLHWLQTQGLDAVVRGFAKAGGRVLGICGGFQMLGERIEDPLGVESSEGGLEGLGLLPGMTTFSARKALRRVEGECVVPGLEGARIRGYEIHHGHTKFLEGKSCQAAFRLRDVQDQASELDGVCSGSKVFGTYVHGLFDHRSFRSIFLNLLRRDQGREALPDHMYDCRPKSFRQLADLLRDSVDLAAISRIVGLSLEKM